VGSVEIAGYFFFFLILREQGLELEFLTHETTCASEMLEKTTCENFCQKRHVARCRQAPAAVAVAGT
jgi:hypothetical protein